MTLPDNGETEENISAESPFPFLIHITGTSGTVAVLSAFKRGSSTKAGFSASGTVQCADYLHPLLSDN